MISHLPPDYADRDDLADDRDRPRYRVLVRPFDLHDADGARLPAGYELVAYRVDATWLRVGGRYAHEPLGVTQVLGARPSLADVRATVVNWLRARADPLPCGATPADVEVYALVEDRLP